MNNKKICLLSFVIAMLFFLSACFGESGDESSFADTSEESQEQSELTEESSEEPSEESSEELPPAFVYDDVTLSVMIGGEERLLEFSIEDENENGISSSFAQRIENIKTDHGISFDLICVPENDDMATEIASRSQSGIETDLVFFGASSFGRHAVSGLYYDLNGLEGLEKLKNDPSSQSLSVMGKLYFVTGSVCVTSYDSVYALFYNKALAADDLYDDVRDGVWTVDRMYEYAKKASANRLSFSSPDAVFGIVSRSDDALAFMTACGEDTVQKDENGIPVRNIGKKTNTAFYEKIKSVLSDPSSSGIAENYGNWKTTYDREKEIFFDGRALFMPYTLSLITREEREIKTDIGILPMPKQTADGVYRTPTDAYSLTAAGIPTSNISRVAESCAALEALDYYGRHDVREAYFADISSALRLSDDDVGMLKIITENVSFDIGSLYIDSIGGDASPMRIYASCVTSDEAFEVLVNPSLPAYERGIEAFIEKINQIK